MHTWDRKERQILRAFDGSQSIFGQCILNEVENIQVALILYGQICRFTSQCDGNDLTLYLRFRLRSDALELENLWNASGNVFSMRLLGRWKTLDIQNEDLTTSWSMRCNQKKRYQTVGSSANCRHFFETLARRQRSWQLSMHSITPNTSLLCWRNKLSASKSVVKCWKNEAMRSPFLRCFGRVSSCSNKDRWFVIVPWVCTA